MARQNIGGIAESEREERANQPAGHHQEHQGQQEAVPGRRQQRKADPPAHTGEYQNFFAPVTVAP
ncbi:hypothetical protein D3C73_1629130 [compost metagenome]